MNCQEAQQLLLEIDGGTISPRELTDAVAHAASCPICQEAQKQYARIRGVLASNESGSAASPTGGWAAFEQRLLGVVGIAGVIGEVGQDRNEVREDQRPTIGRRFVAPFGPFRILSASTGGRWRLGIGSAVAASLLLGALGFWLGKHYSSLSPLAGTQPTNGIGSSPGSSLADGPRIRWTDTEVAQQAGAFEQVQQVFDHRAKWLLVANGDSDLGLSEEPLASAHDTNMHILLLRLTMLHQNQVVSTADLAIVPGQSAKLNVPLSGGNSLRYEIGTSEQEPTRLSLWVELQTPHGGETLAALATTLQLHPDEKASAGQLVTSSGRYELKVAFSRATRTADRNRPAAAGKPKGD